MGQKLSDVKLYQMALDILKEHPELNNCSIQRIKFIAKERCELESKDADIILDAFNLYVLKGISKWLPKKNPRR